MAQRPVWRGNIRLALVSCPVALYTARHDRNAIKFNMINPQTGNRIRMVTMDAETNQELSRGDTVKGYEFKKNTYLLLSNEDFASVRVESSTTMSIEKFVDAHSIDPVYYDSSYFLGPDGKDGKDVYAVLRDAIAQTGRVALARVVMSQRERTIAIRPTAGGLVAQTLYDDRDLNSAAEIYDGVAEAKSDPEMVKLAVQLIDRQTGRYDPSDVEDRYERRLREMIDAKLKGEGLDLEEDEVQVTSNVVDIMALLKKSLGGSANDQTAPTAAKAASKRAAKAPSPEDLRRQTGLKLPIAGGKAAASQEVPKRAAGAASGKGRGVSRGVG